MGQVIADVAKDTAAVYQQRRMPVVKENSMSQLPERRRQHDEQSRGHHKSIPVHRQVMVNAVKKEVEAKSNTIVREPTGSLLDATGRWDKAGKHTRRYGTKTGA